MKRSTRSKKKIGKAIIHWFRISGKRTEDAPAESINPTLQQHMEFGRFKRLRTTSSELYEVSDISY